MEGNYQRKSTGPCGLSSINRKLWTGRLWNSLVYVYTEYQVKSRQRGVLWSNERRYGDDPHAFIIGKRVCDYVGRMKMAMSALHCFYRTRTPNTCRGIHTYRTYTVGLIQNKVSS